MSSDTVVVVGSGSRAAEWATRLLASGFDVVADDRTLPQAVQHCWPAAERMGLFPGASPDRLVLGITAQHLADARLVQVVGDAAVPATDALVATDATAHALSPIHLVPVVVLADGPHTAALAHFYEGIGMAPCLPGTPADEVHRMGQGLIDVTGSDPDSIIAVMRALRATGVGAGPSMAA
ncbi:MAG: hypothetical protein WCP59_14260, partial [Actinomycetota bacterium]